MYSTGMNESKFHISVMKLNFLSSIFFFFNTDVKANTKIFQIQDGH